jgi:hypothetical protein
VVDWEGERFVVRTRRIQEFDESEAVHVSIDPRHCVLIES